MSRFPAALRNTAEMPAGPGRRTKTRQQWEAEGFSHERVLNASRSKSKTEAANLLSLHKNNRYMIVKKIFKAFAIKENYSKTDSFARINSNYATPQKIVEEALKSCNDRDFTTA